MRDLLSSKWRRRINRYVAPVTAGFGLVVVLASFLFLGNLLAWYLTVLGGLVVILAGFLYGAYPFLTSERRYLALRQEVDEFIGLVRRLNRAATAAGSPEEFEQVKAEMMAAVERMASLAGKEG